jgi:hypothetical protein
LVASVPDCLTDTARDKKVVMGPITHCVFVAFIDLSSLKLPVLEHIKVQIDNNQVYHRYSIPHFF